MKNRSIYLDNAATTPTDKRVLDVIIDIEKRELGNPSSMHSSGQKARDIIEISRKAIADALGAHGDEIIFTGSGTESDNIAIIGTARAHASHGKHIISVKTEHPAVLSALKYLKEKEGFEITLLEVDEFGQVKPEDVISALRDDTILVSIMYANNEIGTIHPLSDIGRAIISWRKKKNKIYPIFHSDACQAFGYLDCFVEQLHVDLLTINSSKIYGPKGIGALFVRRGIKISPIQFGGEQENSLRPGTESASIIAGFARAAEISKDEQKSEVRRLTKLRDYFIKHLYKQVPNISLNGHPKDRLPNNINISFLGVEGESLLLHLDAHGIFASSGSACTSKKLDPSHVILALGKSYIDAHGSLRFSLGRHTKKKDIKRILEVLPPIVEGLRKISPIKQ
jgi:cysteine desulfurase